MYIICQKDIKKRTRENVRSKTFSVPCWPESSSMAVMLAYFTVSDIDCFSVSISPNHSAFRQWLPMTE